MNAKEKLPEAKATVYALVRKARPSASESEIMAATRKLNSELRKTGCATKGFSSEALAAGIIASIDERKRSA